METRKAVQRRTKDPGVRSGTLQAGGPATGRRGEAAGQPRGAAAGSAPRDPGGPPRPVPHLQTLLATLALLPALLAAPVPAAAQEAPAWTVELEGGPVWQSYNDAEIPNDGTATRFSVEEITGSGPWPAGRLYLTWRPATRHALRVLAAPLTIRETGTAPADVVFQGATFRADTPVEATYTFNSWRVTYRYRFHEGDATRAWVGFTAKLRDAVVALEQEGTEARKTDLGFVPLLHLAGSWRFAPRWSASLDADALAGGPGRAVDAALEVGYDVTPDWTVQLGYRTVEGGADVEEVYSFAWLHYAAVSLVWRP